VPPTGSAARLLLALASTRSRPPAWGLWAIAGAVLMAVVVRHAWAAEDAFITFRTVQQFVNGEGLRWNIDERVQVYTHPLWMFACVPLYAIFRDVATSSAVLGLLCTFGTWLALGTRYAARPAVLLLGAFVPLVSSTAIHLYATSGFENSMSFMLFSIYAVLLLRGLDRDRTPWFWLALVGSLGVVNRLDTVVFYVPPMLFVMLSRWREIRWGAFLAGYAPVVAWLLFSTFYYGFPYPNTALAKINEEFPRHILVRQGIFYAVDLLWRDPAGFLTLSLGIVLTFVHLVRAGLPGTGDRRRAVGVASLGLGIVLYGFYVVWIGGSFLSRRHWSVQIVGAAILLSETLALVARGAVAAAERGELDALFARQVRRPALWAGAAALGALAGVVLVQGPQIDPDALARRMAPDGTRESRPRKILELPAGRMELTEDFTWRTSKGGMGFVRKGQRLKRRGIGRTTTIGITSITAGTENHRRVRAVGSAARPAAAAGLPHGGPLPPGRPGRLRALPRDRLSRPDGPGPAPVLRAPAPHHHRAALQLEAPAGHLALQPGRLRPPPGRLRGPAGAPEGGACGRYGALGTGRGRAVFSRSRCRRALRSCARRCRRACPDRGAPSARRAPSVSPGRSSPSGDGRSPT
jgi:arabinofuranosyltransferase